MIGQGSLGRRRDGFFNVCLSVGMTRCVQRFLGLKIETRLEILD